MTARTILGTLDGTTTGQRLVVSLVQRGGGLRLDLREQHHAEGIGWFDQCGVELDPRQLRQLQGLLGPRGLAPCVGAGGGGEVPISIAFPGPALADYPRATGSDA